MGEVGHLALVFGQLSLVAVGGVSATLPEMQRQVVAVHRWMDAREFAALFALAQAAPGPNMLIATLVGWRVAGLPGALAATLGIVGPPALLSYGVSGAWHRFRDASWRRRVQAGLTPVTVGLVMAAAATLSITTSDAPGTALVTAGTAAVLLATQLNPLWMLAAGAALGVAGFA